VATTSKPSGSNRSIIAPKQKRVEESQTAQARLRAAVFNGVNESDVKDIVAGIVKRAKAGDKDALKYFFEYILGGQVKTAIQNNMVIEQPQPPQPSEPARSLPGSPEKLDVLRARATRGEAIFGNDDAVRDVG